MHAIYSCTSNVLYLKSLFTLPGFYSHEEVIESNHIPFSAFILLHYTNQVLFSQSPFQDHSILLCTYSNLNSSFWNMGDQKCTQFSRDLTSDLSNNLDWNTTEFWDIRTSLCFCRIKALPLTNEWGLLKKKVTSVILFTYWLPLKSMQNCMVYM